MENQVIASSEPPVERRRPDGGNSKKIFWFALILLFVLAGIIGAYFLGQNSQKSASPTPTPELPSEGVTETETPTPTTIASISGTITPTKKLSPTPKLSLTPTPAIKTKILGSSAELDGFRSSNNGGNNTLDIRTGRNINLVTRGFVSFDISDIPTGATIKEATLRLYQAKIIGNPYAVGGIIKIDHLTYGDSLDSSDYGMAALSSSFATLTGNATIEWKDASVTDRLKDDIANARSRSQYRIHFQTETTGGDTTGDFANFESMDNSLTTGNTPQLVVKYY